MRIERLELDGFGRFHDAGWDLPEGLTVLLGANEAGKTTLLNGVRALLFGFESSRDGRAWYPALAGGRRGGRLQLRTAAGERWTVERHGERGGGGALAVRAPNGNQGGQETLDRLLHGADKDLFNNIFAFGLGELQTLASLSADAVRGRIYGAGAGLGGTSAIDLERRLRQQLDADFLPQGSKRPLNQLLARAEELRREIADLAKQPQEHADASRERDELRARADGLRAELRALRERLARFAALRRAVPLAVELGQLEAELSAGDATLDGFAEDAVAVLERRAAELEQARAVLATLDEQLDTADRRRAALRTDEPILAVADELATLAAEAARHGAADGRVRDLEAAAQRHAAAVAEQLARVGGWEEPDLVALDDSIGSVEATRDHERAVADARAALAEAEQRRRAAADELEVRLRELGAGADADDDQDLRARSELVAAFDDLRERRAAAAAVAAHGGGPAFPTGAIAGVAAALGLAVFVAAWLAGAPLPGIALGGATAALAIAVLGRLAAPVASAAPGADAAALDEERVDLLRRLGLPADAPDAAVRTLAGEIAQQRARLALAREQSAALDARRADVDRRDHELQAARELLTAAEDRWAGWLAGRRLPAPLTPEAVRHVLAAAGIARRAVAERDAALRELEALRATERDFAARADDLILRLTGERPADGVRRGATIVGLAERLDRARADARHAAELDAGIAQATERRRAAAATAAEREAALRAHLDATGCPEPDALRRRAAEADARRRLRGTIQARRNELAILAGAGDAVPSLLADARSADAASLEAAEAEVRDALERLEAEEREANSRIGALEARLRQLEGAEELGARRQELAVVEGRAAAMARAWAVRAVALRLLEETRRRYERERQPAVVRSAESHFERITGGRYPRIIAPPGDASVRVEMDGGAMRATDELSRGTSEQLYLALRFGLIEQFAVHAEPLPVVMDDILVNFDADRAARAAAAINDLAGRHQVLYFTCHPWTAQLLDPGGERTVALG
ncbi:MAG TPA: AAA family ATPase [Candidatus Limnocylindria bacterium]|nr:AAA family ATPase [Candidatus Limnocylindria bacterium]